VSERPPKPPFAATLVVRASQELTLAEKVVWLEDHAFDRGPEGAYVSAASVAARWGGSIAPKTVELARNRLKLLGLHDKIARVGARNVFGWFAILPPGCSPARERTTTEEVARLARRLDDHVRRVGDLRLESGQSPAPPAVRPLPPQRADHRRDSGLGAAALGGRGEGSASAATSESSFPPVVKQDGVGSHEPEIPEDGGRRLAAERSTPGSQQELPAPRAIDLRPADEVTDEGFAEMRRRRAAWQTEAEAARRRKAASE